MASIWTMLTQAADGLLTLLYPPRCAVCQAMGDPSPLCAACRAAVVPVPEPFCLRCGHTVQPDRECDGCRLHPPAFDRARALGAYQGVLRHAVHGFKYRDHPALAEPLGALLAEYARTQSRLLHSLAFDGIVPVPMHAARRRQRGYNQSERLACVVARELELPLDIGLLVRARATRPQVGLSGARRRSNLQGAFQVRRPADAMGKSFLLVDDVSTTGASLSECAAMLKLAGARHVSALTLAAG